MARALVVRRGDEAGCWLIGRSVPIAADPYSNHQPKLREGASEPEPSARFAVVWDFAWHFSQYLRLPQQFLSPMRSDAENAREHRITSDAQDPLEVRYHCDQTMVNGWSSGQPLFA